MSQDNDTTTCTLICWGLGVAAGALLAVSMVVIGGWDWTPSLFVAAIAAGVLGLLLATFVCREGTAKDDLEAVRKGEKGAVAANSAAAAASATAPAATASDSAATAAGSSEAAGASATSASATTAKDATAGDGAVVKPSKPLPGQAELAERKGDWKYEGEAKDDAGSSAEPAPAAAQAESTDATPVESEPETLTAPRGTPDDLKKISGVGPKLEGVLNDLGFWHFWQIAQWGPEQVAWVDTRLKFKGRIERDNWIAQAKAFSEGQEL